ncbi:MAG: hypothetical protein Q7T81_16075 [Pseudolabrys sp.]|nr:hypothetical protein [Pseudolabrys sp.]
MTGKLLSYDDFAGKTGEVFSISDTDVPQIPLTLTETERVKAHRGPAGMREPFSLIFVARDPRVLPQRIYRLEHNDLGELDIFLVPIGKTADGVSYQAMFA